MTTCQDLDLLITLRATGDLSDDEAKRLELHLAACARCRAEADADAAVLRQVRLPGPGDAERRATASLARGTLAELRRREGRTAAWKRATAGFLAAAAVLVAVLAPALFGRRGVPGAGGGASGSGAVVATADVAGEGGVAGDATSSWEPDLDTVWDDTAILDDDGAATGGGWSSTSADAALASVELF